MQIVNSNSALGEPNNELTSIILVSVVLLTMGKLLNLDKIIFLVG